MNLKEKFNNIKKNKTDDGFHDACLISLNIEFESRTIQFIIEHYRIENGDSNYYWADLIFYNFEHLILDNEVDCFGKEDQIGTFNTYLKDDLYFFKIIGTQGWVISFSAADFGYKEEYKENLYSNNE